MNHNGLIAAEFKIPPSVYLTGNRMDSLCEPLDISCCDTSDGYSPVFGRVDGMLDNMRQPVVHD